MHKAIIIFLFSFIQFTAFASNIEGTVTDSKGEPLVGVNIYIKDTYDGSTTDLDGHFSFNTSETGTKILIASFVGYKTYEASIDLESATSIQIRLKEDINRLSAVVITAGSFEASDEKKSEVLKPLDIAMTAGATADIAGALNKLPGTTTNGESGRLFVRGGTANETQAFIDGVLVPNFYSPSPNNVPSRSRFSPFLFKGTFFSTGGYSAEFGDALSSILSLSSNDMPDESATEISLMTVGTDVAHTQKWENGSIYGQIQYTNLDPYNNLIKQEFTWRDGFTSTNGTFMLRQKDKSNGILKIYGNFDRSDFAMDMPNINTPADDEIDLRNDNTYLNTNYKFEVGKKSMGFIGLSYSNMKEKLLFNGMDIFNKVRNTHTKAYLVTDVSQMSIKAGGEVISVDNQEDVMFLDGTSIISGFDNILAAGFVESDFYLSSKLTFRSGLRYSSYSNSSSSSLSPRLSMALKTGMNSQLSAAFGKFSQLPESNLLLRSSNLGYEKADHYMLSYQSSGENRVFRSEVYYKKYDKLVKFNPVDLYNPFAYNSNGTGYAKGLDLFWRDGKTIKNAEYWVSYSFLDTQRDFRDYEGMANPTFAARHNFSVVYKHFITSLKTQIGWSYSYNSGRPYNDPNKEGFNQSFTPDYSDLSFNLAYLFRQNIILYASATNLLGRDNIFGYQFEDNAGPDNVYDSRAIGQAAKRFLFIGIFITLTKDNTSNNLENL